MAYAALVSLAQTIDHIMNDDQYFISTHKKRQIRIIHEHTIHLLAFLEDFPQKAKNLEARIRAVANQAEDIIENFMWEKIHSRLRFLGSSTTTTTTANSLTDLVGWTTLITFIFGILRQLNLISTVIVLFLVAFRFLVRVWRTQHAKSKFKQLQRKFALPLYDFYDLKKVTKEIDLIAGEVTDIKNSVTIEQQHGDSYAAATSSILEPTHKDVMICFADDLMAIKTRLCGESSKLQVIPIFGMGGIGKTTLARNAYNDPLIMEHFQILAWVTVKQNYSIDEILSGLLDSIKELRVERRRRSNEENVYKRLKGRRYLIVMDDMWSTKVWDDVKNIFPDDNNGSRIMLTTRLLDVAAYPNSSSASHAMRLMDDDQSWNLLQQKVFADHGCPLELENIGKEIARSCKGLPLAIVVVAGILSTMSKDQASWGEIAANVNSVVAAKDGQFEEIVSLSYTHLPHHLRPCFFHLGCFPEDHEVRVSKLIKLWVAEGFLKCPNGSQSLEEKAEDCLEDLVRRSVVMVTKRKSNGKIKSCSLHDLMRDLCIRRAIEEKFLVNICCGHVEKELLGQHRLSCTAFPQYPLGTYGSTIHTIMWFLYAPLPFVGSCRLLRVLDAGDADIKSLPDELFELFHLRYLAINYFAHMIPPTIVNLQNLQTLIIQARGEWKLDATYMDCLPQVIWRMPRLRHLLFYGTLPDPKGSTLTLENLHTLLFSLSDHTCTEGILEMIPNLKKLEINCCHREGVTFLRNLVCLHQLENLVLHSHSNSIAKVWQKDDFTFPRMLKKLTLSGLRLHWNEMTTICSLPNLQVFKLRDYACTDSRWETTGGEFPKLEFLLIEKSYLEHWITETSHFPRLKFLLIHDCWRLSEIPYGFGELPTLELIEVRGHVKKSLVQSAKRIQEEQQSWGNDALQVRCMTH